MLFAENIAKTYRKPVLRGVSLTARRGELVGLAGANGSGKSTLLSILASIVSPDGGQVSWDGAPPSPSAIGFVPQENSLFGDLSARDNLRFWCAAHGVEYRAGLFDEAHLPVKAGKLSGGMKKQLSIAIALLCRPEALLMDEPTAALDVVAKTRLLDWVTGFCAAQGCAVVTTHQPDELLLCDRIYILRDGVFVYQGEPLALAPPERFRDELYKLAGGAVK